MADVYAIFGTLLALGIAFPGMLTAWWLLFPNMVDRAETRVGQSPWMSFAVGALAALVLAVPIVILLALPLGPAKFLGGLLLLATLTFASLGAAGIAATMAGVLRRRMGDATPALAAFVRGALALELAAAFPFLGWFLIIPLTMITSLGASTLALLGRSSEATGSEGAALEGAMVHEPQSA